MALIETPWKVSGGLGRLANGWKVSGIGTIAAAALHHADFWLTGRGVRPTDGAAIVGLGPGMNGSGGDNRVVGVGRNTYRFPRRGRPICGRQIDRPGSDAAAGAAGGKLQPVHHQNVTEVETTGYYLEPGSMDGTPRL